MISVETATRLILENSLSPQVETVPLQQAVGRILSEDIIADRNFPPFDRVTMDGVAILFDAYQNGHRRFPIEQVAPAGKPQAKLSNPLHCIEVMTGATVPDNADTVIKYEDIEIEDGVAIIGIETVKKNQNVHYEGEDRVKGDVLVPAGTKLTPAEIGVAATVGKTTLQVTRWPRVAIISNGDELVGVEAQPQPHQIRISNRHTIAAVMQTIGLRAEEFHFPDDENLITEELPRILLNADVLIFSGGVSEGRFDYVHKVLTKLGVQKLFHKVFQRPGKPFWFGIISNAGEKKPSRVIFALPGNPVSTFMCTLRFFMPWFKSSAGMDNPTFGKAILAEDFTFKPDLTYFLQVKIKNEAGHLMAYPVPGHGSGDLANLVEADGFLELPRGKDHFYTGEPYPYIPFR